MDRTTRLTQILAWFTTYLVQFVDGENDATGSAIPAGRLFDYLVGSFHDAMVPAFNSSTSEFRFLIFGLSRYFACNQQPSRYKAEARFPSLFDAKRSTSVFQPDGSVLWDAPLCRMTNPCRFGTHCGCVARSDLPPCLVRAVPPRCDSLLPKVQHAATHSVSASFHVRTGFATSPFACSIVAPG